MTYAGLMANNFRKNVKAICQKKNIKLGELEKKVGVTSGYFSRQATTSLEIAIITAQLLDMTIDDVCKYNPRFEEIKEHQRRIHQLKREIEMEK